MGITKTQRSHRLNYPEKLPGMFQMESLCRIGEYRSRWQIHGILSSKFHMKKQEPNQEAF